jgi:hypothetical protein
MANGMQSREETEGKIKNKEPRDRRSSGKTKKVSEVLDCTPFCREVPQHLDQAVGEGIQIDVELANYVPKSISSGYDRYQTES